MSHDDRLHRHRGQHLCTQAPASTSRSSTPEPVAEEDRDRASSAATSTAPRKVPIIEALQRHRPAPAARRRGSAWSGTTARASPPCCGCCRGSTSRPGARRRSSGRVAPVFDLGVGMDPEISGLENILVRGPVPRHDPQADGGAGRRHRRVHRAGRLPAHAAAHILDRHADPPRAGRRHEHRPGDPAPRRGHRRGGRGVPGEGQEAAGRAGRALRPAGVRLALRRVPPRALRHGDLAGARPDPAAGRPRGRAAAVRRAAGRDPAPAGGSPATGSVIAVVVTRHRAGPAGGTAWPPSGRADAGGRTTSSSSTTAPTTSLPRIVRRLRPAVDVPAQSAQPGRRRRLRARHAACARAGRRLGLVRRRRRPARGRARPGHACSTRPPGTASPRSRRWWPTSPTRDRLAFPLRRGLRWRRRRSDFADIRRAAALRVAVQRGAVPRRGARRRRRPRLPAVLPRRRDRDAPAAAARRAALRHGDGRGLPAPRGLRRSSSRCSAGRLSAQYPDERVKRYFTYRNRGYLMAQPGMRWLLPLEWIRFSWYFLVTGATRGLAASGSG